MGASDRERAVDGRDEAQLLATAAHELRTPVSVVGGYLRMLQRDSTASLSPAQRKLIDDAIESCARLSSLVDEMSELARLEAGMAPGVDACDLFALLRSVAVELSHETSMEPRIVVELPDEPAPVKGDATRLRRALSTVLRAVARERTASGAILTRGWLDDPDGRAIVVAGTAAEVEGAFHAPREAVDVTRGGLGLGLPIARQILAQHGGTMWAARSEAARAGRGAIVLSLPTSASSAPRG